MRAVEVAQTGGPEVLQYIEKPMPTPGPDEVLRDVVARISASIAALDSEAAAHAAMRG